jgi:ubiquinone/menaquinone biosynthesis C-methylase UbiE
MMEKNYVLRGGERGAERLRLLASVKWPTTKTLLAHAGLREGMHCLDIGCGIGEVTLAIAEWVGSAGRVVGMDVDERALKLARLESKRRGCNVKFRVGSAVDLDESAAYDFVFARFVLTHLSKPEQALARMIEATRVGGVVVVEDIDFTGHFSFPACAAFERYVTLYQEVVRRKGGDSNIGPRLLGMCQDAGLHEIQLSMVQPTFHTGPGKQMAAVTMEHIREAVVAAKLASDAEIDNTLAELDSFTANPRTLLSLPRIFQVWGTRP